MIEQRAAQIKAAMMSAREVLARQSEIARGDIAEFVTPLEGGGFSFDLSKAKGKTHLIKSLRHDPESGAPIIELYPADKAQERLMRVHKLLGEPTAQAVAPTVVNVQLLLQQLPTETLRQLADAARVAEAKDITPTAKTEK